MLIPADEVRGATRVPLELKLLQLRNRNLQGLLYARQPSIAGSLRYACQLFKEVSTKRIVSMANRTVGFTDELRNDMQVGDRSQEFRQRSILSVDVDLFEIGLRQPLRVSLVLVIRSLEQKPSLLLDSLGGDARDPTVVLTKRQVVLPRRTFTRSADGDLESDLWISTRRQSADPRNATAAGDRLLKAAADRDEIREKAEGIQKVRLSRRVGPDEEDAPLQRHVDAQKVAPVLEPQGRDSKVSAF